MKIGKQNDKASDLGQMIESAVTGGVTTSAGTDNGVTEINCTSPSIDSNQPKMANQAERGSLADRIFNQIGKAVLVPVAKGEKKPMLPQWQNLIIQNMTPRHLSMINENVNVGVVLGKASMGLVSIDCDTNEGLGAFLTINPALTGTLISKGKRGGNVWVRVIDTYPKTSKIRDKDGNPWGEFRSDGGQTVIWGVHPSGCNYTNNGMIVSAVEFSNIKWVDGLHLPWVDKPKEIPTRQYQFENYSEVMMDHARSYVAFMPSAIEGQGGDAMTFNVAKKLVHDFALSINQAMVLMKEYNARCVPPWDEKQLLRKLEDASKLTHPLAPRGTLAIERLISSHFSNQGSASVAEKKEAALQKEKQLVEAFSKSTCSCTQMKEIKIKSRRKVVGDWLREGDLSFLFASRGLGKTHFALGLATAISSKSDFGPWKVYDHAPVLYVDGEMPYESIKERITALGAEEDLHVLSHEWLFDQTGEVLNLTDVSAQNAITTHCINLGVKFIFLDNLSCLFNGLRENESDSWELVLPWLLSLRRQGISVFIIAHSGRNGQMRGTSRREDAAFSVIRLEEPTDNGIELKDGARFVSRFTKDRNSRVEQPAIEWSFRTDDDGNTWITHKNTDALEALVEWVRDGLTNATDIATEMGLSKGQVSKLAKRAMADGRLVKQGRGYAIP
jgi:hypothetical protein